MNRPLLPLEMTKGQLADLVIQLRNYIGELEKALLAKDLQIKDLKGKQK